MALTITDSTNHRIFGWLRRATSGGTVFAHVAKMGTAFDYFEDACVVNDAFYFGWSPGRFRAVRLFVGTAFAAASVTFVWEYYNAAGSWVALAGLVDGTANFTNLGQGDVSFTVPTDCRYLTVEGGYGYYVRVRISAVDTPTEGGAQSTQTAQLRDHEILVTGVDANNNVFQAIYAADQGGAWGYTSLTNKGIQIACNVGIGDGTTLTSAVSFDERVNIIYDDFRVRNNATLRCGRLHANGYTYDGTVILTAGRSATTNILTEEGSTAYFYDTRLEASGDQRGRQRVAFYGTVAFQDVTLQDFIRGYFCPWATTVSLKRVRLKATRFFPRETPALIEDLYVQGEITYLFTLTRAAVATGAVVESGLAQPYRGYDCTAELIDSGTDPLDENKWTWGNFTVGVDYLLVRYTFNLRVVDAAGVGISGATVAMEDANGDPVFSVATDGSGNIAEQTVTRVRYDPVTATTAVQTDYGPLFTVTISGAGKATRVILYTIDRKREEIEMLEAAVAEERPLTADIVEEAITGDVVQEAISGDVVVEAITGDVAEEAISDDVVEDAVTGDVS